MEMHLPELIYDLAVLLTAAGVITVLFKKLRQPVVLGYILAGLLVGPHVHVIPTVVDLPNLKVWAEIGVIFLLFALGLEFSFKKLVRVGGAAFITAFIEVLAMLGVGYLVGWAMGWSQMDCIFLGGILAISSTTIIIRAFDEAGVKGRRFVSLVFGVLIVEDLFAILLLVVLSTLAITKSLEGMETFAALLKLGFFLVIWFLGGILLVPTMLRKFRPHMNGETLLIFACGLCFLMVIFATHVGFSPALGAFVMGSILAETTDAERIERVIHPVKDLFAAVFFVSVGTLIDPRALWIHAWPVAIISIVTILGKLLSSTLGALLAGQPPKRAIQAGMSLAQIGEFSFIIAGLGVTLSVTSEFLYPIAVGVSALTTFTTPYMIRSSDYLAAYLERTLPGFKKLEARGLAPKHKQESMIDWHYLTVNYAAAIVANAAIVSAIFLTVARWLRPYLETQIESQRVVNATSLAVALAASTPFLWAWLLGKPTLSRLSPRSPLKGPRVIVLTLEILRFGSAIALIGILTPRIVTAPIAFASTMFWAVVVLLLFSRYWKSLYTWLEDHFVSNLAERDRAQNLPRIAPWDAHIAKLEVSPDSEGAGKTLEENAIREKFGITIGLIERGSKVITAPMRHERLLPFDRVSVIGTDDQLAQFKAYIEPSTTVEAANQPSDIESYSLHRVTISDHSPFQAKTIRDSGIRENTHGLVVGMEREGKRILNPDSLLTIEPGDVLWIVGDRKRIDRLSSLNPELE